MENCPITKRDYSKPNLFHIIAQILHNFHSPHKLSQYAQMMSKTGNDTVQSRVDKFYKPAMEKLVKSKLPFMVAGTYAFRELTGINRETHDFDIFCKAGDYTKILKVFEDMGYNVEITDARWLAKASNDKDFTEDSFIDIIFSSASGLCPIDDTWFEHAPVFTIFGMDMQVIPPEEMIWSKSYRQEREKYEGPDINHIILKQGMKLDWHRLLMRMEPHWELLLAHLINFRFVYPSEREIVPKWLIQELLDRLEHQFSVPTPKDKVCRGTLLSRYHYNIDVTEWGFKDVT